MRVAAQIDLQIDQQVMSQLLRPQRRSAAQPGMAARFLTLYRDLSGARDFFSSTYFLALTDVPFMLLHDGRPVLVGAGHMRELEIVGREAGKQVVVRPLLVGVDIADEELYLAGLGMPLDTPTVGAQHYYDATPEQVERALAALREVLARHHHEIAAFIEPDDIDTAVRGQAELRQHAVAEIGQMAADPTADIGRRQRAGGRRNRAETVIVGTKRKLVHGQWFMRRSMNILMPRQN